MVARYGTTDFPFEKIETAIRESVTTDSPFEKILAKAWDFKFRHEKTGESLADAWDQDNYRKRLLLGWYSDYVKLDLETSSYGNFNLKDFSCVRVDSERRVTDYAEFVMARDGTSQEYDSGIKGFEFLIIKCRENRLRSLFENLLDRLSLKLRDRIIWDCDRDENNFWEDPDLSFFRNQIDDSLDPIKSFKINPFGAFTIEYKNRHALSAPRLVNGLIIAAICYKIPFVEYKF